MPLLKDRRAKEAFAASGVFGADRLLKHAQKSITTTFVTPKVADVWAAFNRTGGGAWNGTAGLREALAAAQAEMQQLAHS